MYYSKYDHYIIIFGCICLLVVFAVVTINSKEDTKSITPTESKVTDKDEVDKKLDALQNLDDLSRELVTIRQRLKKQEEMVKGSL